MPNLQVREDFSLAINEYIILEIYHSKVKFVIHSGLKYTKVIH